MLSLKNIATVNQIATIAACTPSHVRKAIADGKLNVVYPFPNNPKKKDNTGQLFIKCDKKLELFIVSGTYRVQLRMKTKSVDPLAEAKKYFKFTK